MEMELWRKVLWSRGTASLLGFSREIKPIGCVCMCAHTHTHTHTLFIDM